MNDNLKEKEPVPKTIIQSIIIMRGAVIYTYIYIHFGEKGAHIRHPKTGHEYA